MTTQQAGISVAAPSSQNDSDKASLSSAIDLQRRLKSRHISMIALGGTIGTGLFLGSGTALSKAGPVGALLAYAFTGSLAYSVMVSLGELATYLPIAGAFTGYAARFVDTSLAFAMGWIYWLSWAITFAIELSAVGIIIQYWLPDLSFAVWIPVFFVLILLINCLPVSVFGELEFWAASIKVIFVIGFLLFAICINAGAGSQGYLGFKYWKSPGPFNAYLVDSRAGKFVGFWAVLIQASFSYQGSELVGIAVAEAENPHKTVPSAIRKTIWRILIFFIGTIFAIGILIPSDNEQLLSDSSDATASPFLIAAVLAGQTGALPSIINAVLLTVILSAANSNVYSGSRILVGLAEAKLAPQIFGRISKHGVPYFAVVFTALVGLLALLNLSEGAGKVFNWLVNISGLAGMITWASISFSHLRFMAALKAQHVDRNTLPYKASWQPYLTYYGFGFMVLIIITQGFTCFIPSFSVEDFFINYISLMLFVVLYAGHKLITRSTIVRPELADIRTGRRQAEICSEKAQAELRSGAPRSFWARLSAWM
ncbi:amino acid permease/ SLC12A domain-containing protein [Protomyces lactucae-debilis]|uniref:Amino acid permease/ SLC12A domain-containing protein n=1 Tax=Protomyces lactucae-debilis TaxID=2754530 RepID=A0A1Y2F9F2_PROLT|nr:amino acid permease/ SLC12A domain-containing protein [Protomyces lactucae-debilis]ORY79525.1 amino acid permease/ SLC12A domain-containing protein [Protomyces lactucae-debilis]